MKSTASMSKDFLRALIGMMFFTVAFTGVCYLVITRWPLEEITAIVPDSEIQCAEVQTVDEAPVEDSLLFTELDPELGKAMQAAILEHARQNDMGLQMYRSGVGNRTAVTWFYTQVTGDADVALAILENADSFDIPISLAFALAWVESRYKSDAVNRNSNSSVDRGLYQLNSNSFPQLTVEEFFRVDVSARYGLSHLRFCLDSAGNEIAALAMYNAGTSRVRKNGTPQTTLNYVSSIMEYKDGLDMLFEMQFSEEFMTEDGLRLALAKQSFNDQL